MTTKLKTILKTPENPKDILFDLIESCYKGNVIVNGQTYQCQGITTSVNEGELVKVHLDLILGSLEGKE